VTRERSVTTRRGLDTRHGRPRESARILDTFLEEALEGDDERLDFELLLATEPETPSRSLKDRLLDALSVTNRFDDLEERVAELADLSREQAKALLLRVDAAPVWEPGPTAGIEIFHFTGGEKVRNAVTGFVRVAPDVAFPEHEHVGDENVLVLTGKLADSSGESYGPGEIARMPAGSQHSFHAVGPTLLLLMTVVQQGVIVGGQLIPPGDPRA
jgi:quercetin dioxygenase-like cupin family protein